MARTLMDYLFSNHGGYTAVASDSTSAELDEFVHDASSPQFSTVPIGDQEGVLALGKVTFQVLGMVCSACSSSIESTVKRLPGVDEVSVSVLQNQAQVVYHPRHIKVGIAPRRRIWSVNAREWAKFTTVPGAS